MIRKKKSQKRPSLGATRVCATFPLPAPQIKTNLKSHKLQRGCGGETAGMLSPLFSPIKCPKIKRGEIIIKKKKKTKQRFHACKPSKQPAHLAKLEAEREASGPGFPPRRFATKCPVASSAWSRWDPRGGAPPKKKTHRHPALRNRLARAPPGALPRTPHRPRPDPTPREDCTGATGKGCKGDGPGDPQDTPAPAMPMTAPAARPRHSLTHLPPARRAWRARRRLRDTRGARSARSAPARPPSPSGRRCLRLLLPPSPPPQPPPPPSWP